MLVLSPPDRYADFIGLDITSAEQKIAALQIGPMQLVQGALPRPSWSRRSNSAAERTHVAEQWIASLDEGPDVAEVESRLSVIDELEATVEANLPRAGRLRQSVFQQAFSGTLPLVGELQLNERAVYESRR